MNVEGSRSMNRERSSSGVSAREQVLFVVGLTASLILGAVFRLHALGLPAFDCDELYAVRIQGGSLKEAGLLIGRSAFHDVHPPLSYLLFMAWTNLFGTAEAAVRSLSVLLGLTSIALIALLGRRIGGVWTGLAAAGFLAFNPLHIAYSQEARPYALVVALTIAAHLFFARSLAGAAAWNRAVYALLVAAALFTHYFAMFALLPHALLASWLMLSGDEDSRYTARQTLLAFACGAASFLAWLPAFLFQLTGQGPPLDVLDLGRSPLGRTAFYLKEVEGLGAPPLLLPAVAALLVLLAFALAWRQRLPAAPAGAAGGSPPRWLGALLLSAGLLLAAAMTLVAPRLLFPPARQALLAKGYAPEAVERELHGLLRLVVSFPLALGVVGLLVLGWPWLSSLLSRLPRVSGQGRPLAVNVLLAGLLLVPAVAAVTLGLAGVPLLSKRNLLVCEAPMALALGVGATRLAQVRRGALALAPIVLCLALARFQYQPMSALFGRNGMPLGMQTGAWRDLVRELNRRGGRDLPLVVAETPGSDPALFYLRDRSVRRIAEPSRITRAALPGEFRFVHLKGDRTSDALLSDVSRVTPLRPEFQVDEFVIYDAGPASRPGSYGDVARSLFH
jgi:4-amino-4-deoxy-L-arabinose transferase-like glycosyltransferase